MKNEYKEEIKKLNNDQLDYNIIRKLLTIDGHYSTECEFTTPSDLLKREFALYDMMLKDNTIKSIKTLYNTDVNTFLFSYSIVRNAKKAFLRAIDFNNNYQKEKNDPSMKDKFNKFFKYEIKYVIVIQNSNIKVIRVNNNTIVKDLQTINDNDFQVILYFVKQEAIPKQIEKPKEEITPKELEQHEIPQQSTELKRITIPKNTKKRSVSQIKEIKSINDYYDNQILFNNLQSKQSTKRNYSIDTHQYKNVSDTKKNHGNNLSNTVGEEKIKEIKQSNNISNEDNKKIAKKEKNLAKFINKNQEIKRNNCIGQNINNNTKVKSNDTITKMTAKVVNQPKKIFINLTNIGKNVFASGHSTEDIDGKFK